MKFSTVVSQIVIAGVLTAIAGITAAQRAYPSKPIRFVVPFPPGGSTDPMARMAAQKMTEQWGHPIIVENRAGGNGIIGADIVAKAPSDGYTILLIASGFVTSPSLLPYLPYDTIRDFDAVTTISKYGLVLVLNPSVPANTLQEFIALAKSRPGQINYASGGVGSPPHLAGEFFNIIAGTKLNHIPYKGTGQFIADLIGGQVQLSFQAPISAVPQIKSGKFKAIAVSGETRLAAIPQVPTFAEAGLNGYKMGSWTGIVAPARTPKEIINKIANTVSASLVTPEVNERLVNEGMQSFISTPAEFAAIMKADMAKFAKIIKTANIKLEN